MYQVMKMKWLFGQRKFSLSHDFRYGMRYVAELRGDALFHIIHIKHEPFFFC